MCMHTHAHTHARARVRMRMHTHTHTKYTPRLGPLDLVPFSMQETKAELQYAIKVL
jgi:hypothetical protein